MEQSRPNGNRRSTLVYMTSARMPTEKAYGFQIAKMCEAFVSEGAEVELWHPKRRQSDPALRDRSIHEYYGVQKTFTVRSLNDLDIFRLQRALPARGFTLTYTAYTFVWSWAAVRSARSAADIYVTRDPELAYWLTRFGMPTVFEVHGLPQRARRALLRKIAGRPSLRATIALTRPIAEELVAMGFSEVSILPDAVDPERFSGLGSRAECRIRLGLPADRPIVGYVGRFRTMGMEKGLPELIEAFARIVAREPRPLLLCVGGPVSEGIDYRAIADHHGLSPADYLFSERVPNPEVPTWIRACDIATIPWPSTRFSELYTSPLKLFEYMAAGVAIVSSDLRAIRDVLTHALNAWLVEPGDVQALAEGLARLLGDADLRESLAATARKDSARYTWRRRAASILERVGST